MTTKQLTYFDRWYKHYPNKKAKGRAKRAFVKVLKENKDVPVEELLDMLIAAVELQKKSVAWLKDNGTFIPHPASWLNAEMWSDGVEVVRQPEIRRADDIEKINRQKERDTYSEWIMEQEIGSLYRWAKVQSGAIKALVAELRPKIIEYAKEH